MLAQKLKHFEYAHKGYGITWFDKKLFVNASLRSNRNWAILKLRNVNYSKDIAEIGNFIKEQ